jgi:hypothetical protein
MNKEERRAAITKFLDDVDWDSYDYTKAPGANMKFPDFTDAQVESNPPWIPKHYNPTSEWNCVHVPDLNQMAEGAERRLYALYGVPVSWPTMKEDPDALDMLITDMDDAKIAGGAAWKEALDQHGLLNDEHYTWIRGRALGIPEQIKEYEQGVKAMLAIDKNPDACTEFGFRDVTHYQYFKLRMAKAKQKAWATFNVQLEATHKALDERFEKNKQALSGELAPFMGVSLEDWAGANAALAQAKPLAHVLKVLGLEQPKWDAVNAEWNARMSRDTTATVATVYGPAFTGAGQGKFAAAAKNVSASMKSGSGKDVKGDEPISFEDWIKIQAHMNAALAQGIDPNALLKKYDLNAADWGAAGGYWALKMNSNPMEYMDKYQVLTAKYATAFTGAKAGSDIDF